jgi:conjugal transfer pilus assembly protein TraK
MHLSSKIVLPILLLSFIVHAEEPQKFGGYENVLGMSGPTKTAISDSQGSEAAAGEKTVETLDAGSGDSQKLRDELLSSRTVEPVKQKSPEPASQAAEKKVDKGATQPVDMATQKTAEKANAMLASRYTTRRELDMKSGENRIVYMSLGNLNRIITPFKSPKIFHTGNESTTKVFKEKNVVYVGASDPRPFGIFISPEDSPEVSINLTVSPEPLTMPQEYKVVMDGYEEVEKVLAEDANKESAKDFEKLAESDYQGWIKEFAKTLISGDLPSGYSPESVAEKGNCVQPNMTTELYQRLVGGEYSVDVYRVKNSSSETQIIQERFCYRKGVRFILAWEDAQLSPGGESDLFIVRENTVEPFNERPKYGK